MRKIAALVALGCAATASYGQNINQIELGATAGWYIPTGGILRDAFGAQIFTIGLTPVATSRPSSGSLTPSFNIIGADKNGSKFLLIPVTLGYEYHFTGDDNNTSSTIPYARLEGGAAYYNYDIQTGPGTSASASRFGWVADAELGLMLNKTIHVSAKYYIFQQQSGIDFNGFQLGVTFGFLRL